MARDVQIIVRRNRVKDGKAWVTRDTKSGSRSHRPVNLDAVTLNALDEFLTGVKRVASGLSGPARSGFVDSYFVGSFTASGTRDRRRCSGGMVYRSAMIARACSSVTGRPSTSRTM